MEGGSVKGKSQICDLRKGATLQGLQHTEGTIFSHGTDRGTFTVQVGAQCGGGFGRVRQKLADQQA